MVVREGPSSLGPSGGCSDAEVSSWADLMRVEAAIVNLADLLEVILQDSESRLDCAKRKMINSKTH